MNNYRLSRDVAAAKSTIDTLIEYIEDLEFENESLQTKVKELEERISELT